jgi:hypothetical protein
MSSLVRLDCSGPILLSLLGVLPVGCARLPETTRTIQEDDRVLVKMETDLDASPEAPTAAKEISAVELTKLLRGFSVRPRPRFPLQMSIKDTPPRKLLPERELLAVVPALQEALHTVRPHERIRFDVFSPGRNPAYLRDVTGGWIKIRGRYFHLHVDYFHVEQPIRKIDAYFPNYPSPWTPERSYDLFFEPRAAYVSDPMLDLYAVDLEKFVANGSP